MVVGGFVFYLLTTGSTRVLQYICTPSTTKLWRLDRRIWMIRIILLSGRVWVRLLVPSTTVPSWYPSMTRKIPFTIVSCAPNNNKFQIRMTNLCATIVCLARRNLSRIVAAQWYTTEYIVLGVIQYWSTSRPSGVLQYEYFSGTQYWLSYCTITTVSRIFRVSSMVLLP